MPLNPLSELKRHLEDDTTPLPKRLCLAKNIVLSHHFPSAPKQRIVSEWMEGLSSQGRIDSGELKKLIDSLGSAEELTGLLKSRLIYVVSEYIQNNEIQNKEKEFIVSFLENDKISSQLSQMTNEFMTISITLLKNMESASESVLIKKILTNFIKYYRENKKKLEFISKFLQRDVLEVVFSYLDTDIRHSVIDVCQNILFPLNKRQFFISYLQTLIWKDNLDELIAEKGDNIQSVLKIMTTFFNFNRILNENDGKFLKDFIDVFVTCFRSKSQIIFAFYIMIANVFEMENVNITPSTKIIPITFAENQEKAKRTLFLNILQILLTNEIDISVRLTDTFGERVSKVEIQKNFSSLLQNVMISQLKLEGKADKTTINIIKTALKLDPSLIQDKIEIIPKVMSLKKPANVIESYIEMLNCLQQILFKLSHGTIFLNQILPYLKLNLEAGNTEQKELWSKIKENKQNGLDCEKLRSKMITVNDVMPIECIEMYGKLTMDLMFRQNKELLESLQRDFKKNCLIALEKDSLEPSTLILTELLSAILSSFFRHSKMADHTVPSHIAQEFWELFKTFEEDCLRRFGKCALKLDKDQSLLKSYLQLCLSYSQLKLLNIKYSNYKLNLSVSDTLNVYDLSLILPCLDSEQWTALSERVTDENNILMNNLILIKTMAVEIETIRNPTESNDIGTEAKSFLIKELTTNQTLLETNSYFPKVLFNNLQKDQCKALAKILVKNYLNGNLPEMNSVANTNNKILLNYLVLEVTKHITKCFNNCENLSKAMSKMDFDIINFAKENDMKNYFLEISLTDDHGDKIKQCLQLLKVLPLPYLQENYQLTAVFILLALKKCCQSKKIRKIIDTIFQTVFELSQHPPDLYQILPVEFIFSFKDKVIIDLLTLKIKNANQQLVIKSLIESAVKRKRDENKISTKIVEIIISQGNTVNSIETFSDSVFQIICIILPLIVKQKKSITASGPRFILTDLQEKLQKILLETFKNIDFTTYGSFVDNTGNTEDSLVESGSNLAILNALPAYTLTLSKYCEATNVDEIKNLDCLWSGLDFFVKHAVEALKNDNTKPQHVEYSIQLLIVTLRHTKKLETHTLFHEKDKLFNEIWSSINSRLLKVFENASNLKKCNFLEDLGVVCKFVCELVSIENFASSFIEKLSNLVAFKSPKEIIKDTTQLPLHSVSKYLWTQLLKANTAGPKCGAMSKTMYQHCKTLNKWLYQHYINVASTKKRKLDIYEENVVIKIDDVICEIIKIDLETLAEVILAGKRVTLDYKFLDEIFELTNRVLLILGYKNKRIKFEISWQAFFGLFESCVAILNSLLISREELLEDRWPCYMQCYRALAWVLCKKSTSETNFERQIEEKLAEIAHNIEKLTQSISKRKKQVSRISAYTVADLCTYLEREAPSKMVRQHLENSVALLIQASDSSYAIAFLKRALAGSVGQVTMTNLYTMYKRYHKYVGNA